MLRGVRVDFIFSYITITDKASTWSQTGVMHTSNEMLLNEAYAKVLRSSDKEKSISPHVTNITPIPAVASELLHPQSSER